MRFNEILMIREYLGPLTRPLTSRVLATALSHNAKA